VAAKKDLYKWIKIAGILSFIPLVLAGGAIAGYLIGGYIEKKFSNFSFAVPTFVVIGLLGSVIEVARIIKLALKIDRES
jgi:hypothetical protein